MMKPPLPLLPGEEPDQNVALGIGSGLDNAEIPAKQTFMGKVKATLDKWEFWGKWVTRLLQAFLIPAGVVVWNFTASKIEDYGKKNFASQQQVLELKTSIDTMNGQLVQLNTYVNQIPKNYWTREEQYKFSIDAIKTEGSLASELRTINTQLANVNVALADLKNEGRSKRNTQ